MSLMKSVFDLRLKKPKALLSLALVMLAIGSYFFISLTWIYTMQQKEHQAILMATSAEAGFSKDLITNLEGNINDIKKPGYQQLKNSLARIVSINNDEIRFAFVYTVEDDKVSFLVNSESPSSENYIQPGQEYQEASDELKRPFTEGKALVTKRIDDRWGSWISVLVPMKDPNTGRTIAALGMHYSADKWNDEAVITTEYVIVFCLCLLLLILAYYGTYLKNEAILDERNKLSYANTQIKEKEELFRTIFEQSPFGIALGNKHAMLIDSNPMLEKITGMPKKEFLKSGWKTFFHDEVLNNDKNLYQQIQAGELKRYSYIKQYKRLDDTQVWVNITVAPLAIENNDALSHLYMVEDITERIQAEQELRESERSKAVLLSNLPGMAYRCSYDRNWTMQFVSEGCFELTGYKPESLIQNKDLTFNDMIAPDYKEKLWNIWKKVLTEKDVFREEYEIYTASGDVKWVFEQGRGVYNENGDVEAIEGFIIDITSRKKREDEIRFLNYHDVLTGLCNRRFFDEEKKRLDHKKYLPLSVIIGDINGLKLINDALGHTEGDKLIIAMANILNDCCRKGDVLARTGGDEFSILLPNTSNEAAYKIIKRIGIACEEYKRKSKDDPYHTSISLGCATKAQDSENLNSIINTAEESMYRSKLLQTKSLHSSVISSMKTAMFEKSQETEEHAQRLVSLSKQIGFKMNLSNEQLNELELLSTLHDIGKIGISDSIINKPCSLTQEEERQMKKHPEIGYRIAMTSQELLPIAEYILCHHERWDGKGYPQGLKGEEIPLVSRILMVVDAYDAMTSDRSYRNAMSKEEAIAEIKKNAGTQFDPNIAKIFVEKVLNKPNIFDDKSNKKNEE